MTRFLAASAAILIFAVLFGTAALAETGLASYYGTESGSRTASGERFDGSGMTAAHRTLPFNTKVRVTLLSSGESVVVRISDRGPYVRGRIVDLSYAAAKKLGIIGIGVARVSVKVVK